MCTLENATEFIGWSLVLNSAMLIYSTVMLLSLKGWIVRTHQKLFNIEESELHKIYFYFLAFYKILIIVFNLVPYIALKIMG